MKKTFQQRRNRYTEMQHLNNGTTLIMGLGNVLLGDEGFGIHVARRLKQVRLPDHVKIEEGGVGGFDLLGYLNGVTRLLVIDVMMADMPPGELRLIKLGPELAEPGKTILSFHQVGVLELIRMWSLIGPEPDTYLLVTRPQKIEVCMELSPSLQHAAGRAAKLVEDIVREEFAGLERSGYLCTS
jgi:hydrogenase maturation protease